VVGSGVGTAALFVGSAAAVAVVTAARVMATAGGGRQAAVLATRQGMQLFAQVRVDIMALITFNQSFCSMEA